MDIRWARRVERIAEIDTVDVMGLLHRLKELFGAGPLREDREVTATETAAEGGMGAAFHGSDRERHDDLLKPDVPPDRADSA